MAAAGSLDEVIEVHEAYLLSIQKQCFVVPDKLVDYYLPFFIAFEKTVPQIKCAYLMVTFFEKDNTNFKTINGQEYNLFTFVRLVHQVHPKLETTLLIWDVSEKERFDS